MRNDADLTTIATWRTSSYSTSGNQCVEVALVPGGGVAVRDSKDRESGTLVVSPQAWTAFVAAIKTGQP